MTNYHNMDMDHQVTSYLKKHGFRKDGRDPREVDRKQDAFENRTLNGGAPGQGGREKRGTRRCPGKRKP